MGYSDEYLGVIQQTPEGGYILGGSSNSTTGYDRTQVNRGVCGYIPHCTVDYWVVKLDGVGNKQWDKAFGGNGEDKLTSLQQTPDGGYVLGGYSASGLSGDKTQAGKGGYDYWLVKVNAVGTKTWDKTLGGNAADFLTALSLSSDGGYIAGGWSDSPASGDKTAPSAGQDFWALKLGGTAMPVGAAPIAAAQELTTMEDSPLTLELTATDADNDALSFTIAQGPAHGTLSGTAPNLTYTPALHYQGPDAFTFTAYDGHQASAPATVSFLVSPVNDAPNLAAIPSQEGGVGLLLSFIAGATDVDNPAATLTFSLAGAPAGATINAANGAFTWTPAEGQVGSHTFTVVVSDGQLSAQQTVILTVKVLLPPDPALAAIKWEKTYGGNLADNLELLRQTSDGGYILGGYSNSGISGDKTQAAKGGNDYWVVKVNADGSKAWDKTYGGSGTDNLYALQQTSDGGYILGGYSNSGISGDKTEANKGGNDYWVVKLHADGSKAWDKTFGSLGTDNLFSLQQTADGGYILGGYSNSGISGDKTQASKGGNDYWVVKLHADGSKAWDKTFGGPASDGLYAIQQTPDGGFILGGNTISGIGGDKTEATLGGNDYWVMKLHADGTKAWDKSLGGNKNDIFRTLLQTTDGGYLLGGYSISDISGNKTQNSKGLDDYWLVKLNADGSKAWDQAFGGSGTDRLHALQQTPDGGYLLGGHSNSAISGDKTEAAKGAEDYWLVKLNEMGTVSWNQTIGGSGADLLYSLLLTSDGGYIGGGVSASGISGDKSAPLLGSNDYWIVKMGGTDNTAESMAQRLNAGGIQVTNSKGVFAADNFFSPTPGYIFTTSSPIAGTSDEEMYQSERASDADNGSFRYDLPVASGQYTVVLHFAELYWNAPGQRVFDVALENALVLDNYDIMKKTGAAFTATSESFVVAVNDGTLNINFSAGAHEGGVNRPKISAMEVIPYAGTNQLPVANAGADQAITLPQSSVALAGSGSDPDGSISSYAWQQVSGPVSATFSSATVAAPTISDLATGVYVFSLSVKDDQQALGAPDQVTLTVHPDPAAPEAVATYRLNAGGPQITNSKGIFAADGFFAPAPGYAISTTIPIAGTFDDEIYQSERASDADNGSFRYDLPVASGQYTVVLHFAELYWNAPGQRVFDVALENALVLDNYDIMLKTGAAFTATSESFVVTVTDGTLNINFSAGAHEGGVNRPKVSAMEVLPYQPGSAARLALAGTAKTEVLNSAATVSAYPNPFRKEINLNMAGAAPGDYTVRVVDLQGKDLYQTDITVGTEAGTYHTLRLPDRILNRGSLCLVVVQQVNGSFRKVIRMMKE